MGKGGRRELSIDPVAFRDFPRLKVAKGPLGWEMGALCLKLYNV